MNERIRQLARDSHMVEVVCSQKSVKVNYPKNFEKFAELIVKECYETIKKDMELAHIQLIPIDFGIYANGRLRRIIKEHFGVEEK